MLWFTETKSGNQLAVNPKYVVVAFCVSDEGEFFGKTGISMINGSIIVDDSLLEVVGQITGANQ
jgi:uncharacterized protein YlzI (FlbEa/FlbD family)